MYKVVHYCFALFTLEIGLFLLIFPWTETWLLNELQDKTPLLQELWQNPFVRTGLSGLGVLNIYLAISDFLRTLRQR
jgi:hypothetical protein